MIASRRWEWAVVTGDGVAVYVNTGLTAALAASGVDIDSIDSYCAEFRWRAPCVH
jgi:hypothetical protein